MLLLLGLFACQKAPVATEVDNAPRAPHTHPTKAGAPVVLDATVQSGEAVVTAQFSGAGANVRVLVWGASGLSVPGEPERWSGTVRSGETVTVRVPYDASTGGDLAVRVAGAFGSETLDEVRSFTVGARVPTPVPQHVCAPRLNS